MLKASTRSALTQPFSSLSSTPGTDPTVESVHPGSVHPGSVHESGQGRPGSCKPASSQGLGTGSEQKAEKIVVLQGVHKRYGNASQAHGSQAHGSQALIDIGLTVRKGDFLFITGPSGSGKSTLLKLLYGEERASEGMVMVDGLNVGELRGDRLSELRRRIGIVFQDYKLIPRRTVAENIAFVLWAQGFSRQEIDRRLPPALKMVGLPHKANSFPDELSGGEQQRVSIARAIVATPPLLLADEPTGNLDADNSWQVIKILKKLNAIGITVIVTTHDEGLIRHAKLPVVQLRNGRLYMPG